MGMSDSQYQSGQRRLLRLLEVAKEELENKYQAKSETLETIMKDIEEELKRP